MEKALSAKTRFNDAIAFLEQGDVDGALSLCRHVIQANPDDINMVALLGAIYLQRNDYSEAEKYLSQAIQLAPSFAKPHEDLGILLVNSGRFAAAVEVLQTAIRLEPSLELANFNLGKALSALGRGPEADKAFEASFELSPQRKSLAIAAKLHKEGKFEEAEHLYRRVLQEYPNNIDALRMLALIHLESSQFDSAERLLKRAIDLAPDFIAPLLDLGKILRDQERYLDAIVYLERAISLCPQAQVQPQVQAQTLILLASCYAPIGRIEEAIKRYTMCLELNPDHPAALLGLGHTLKTSGRVAEGIKSYRRCLSVKPENGETYWSLANLKTFSFTSDEIANMEKWLATEKLDDNSRVNFLFALGKAHEDKADFEQAWHYYKSGNDQQRMRVSYDPVQTEVLNDAIINVFDEELFAKYANSGHVSPAPIFILGLPRSGSTLLEQVLASHSMVEGTAELSYLSRVITSVNRNQVNGIKYPEAIRELNSKHLQTLGEDYLRLAQIHRHENKVFFIDKMPNNFPHIGMLQLMLPNAKIIDARRHPFDACLGNFRQLFAKGQAFTYDLQEIAEYYLQYQRLMDHWDTVLPGKVLHVQYEEVVTDFENQIRRLLEFCGLPWEDQCLQYYNSSRAVRTASSEQVRQPIYKTSLNFWRNYEMHLDELFSVLEPFRERYRCYEYF